MNPTDHSTLRARLSELADALGSKAPGEAGVKAWYIALKDFPIEQVINSLDHWLRTKPKMPAPADIRKILSGILSDRIEAHAIAEKQQFAIGAKRILSEASRCIGREHLGKIALILNSKPHSPDDWWHALITRWCSGEELVWMQMVNAKLAWEKSGRPEEWAPPGHDPEREAERAAIQHEADPL